MQYYYEMLHTECEKIKKAARLDSFYCLWAELFRSLDRSLSEFLKEFLKCE